MCLWDQGIDKDDGDVGRVRRAHGLSNDDGGVGRGRGIDNTSEGLKIRGRRQRLWRRNDRPGELATKTEASAEEDEPEVLTTTTEASAEEAEETTRLYERL